MPEVQLSGGNILITLAVILIVLEGISVLSKGIDAWKKLTGKDDRKKEMDEVRGRIGDLETWRKNVDARLKQGDQALKDNKSDTMEVLKALHRIIKHLQSGNDHEKLKETDDQLYEYLLKKGVSKDVLE